MICDKFSVDFVVDEEGLWEVQVHTRCKGAASAV